MNAFSRLTAIINICMIFCYIQEHADAYPLFYDRFWCLFKRIVFQNYFWRREKDCRPGRLLFFAAVSLMVWLASGFPSGLFPAVRDLFLPECFGRRDRGIFIITVYLCTEFQIFSLFFFQPDCCFIKLVLEFFYLIQCIIPLFFCFQGAFWLGKTWEVSIMKLYHRFAAAHLIISYLLWHDGNHNCKWKDQACIQCHRVLHR